MFTGIIEELGQVRELVERKPGTYALAIDSRLAAQMKVGDSLAINGCCLTVTSTSGTELVFDLLRETVLRTNLGALRAGDFVNLERSMAADGRFGGHLVQGHVDSTAPIRRIEEAAGDHRLEIELPLEFAHLLVFKGSVAVDGISLTVAELAAKSFTLWIIPHTWEVTNLSRRQPGERVNLEFDLMAKYLDRMFETRRLVAAA